MPKADLVQVFPVPGHFLLGVPDIAQSVPRARADELVATGAFTFDPPPAEAKPEPVAPAEPQE